MSGCCEADSVRLPYSHAVLVCDCISYNYCQAFPRDQAHVLSELGLIGVRGAREHMLWGRKP